MATAWFVNVIQPPPPPPLHQYRLTIRSNSFINTIQQQQRHHNEPSVAVVMLSLKTDDTTTSTTVLESTSKSTSETSIKIRALASFISMNMLESMLAAGIPIEKIISMTALSSSNSSSSSPPDDDATGTTTPFSGITTSEMNGGGGAVTDDTLLSIENSESSSSLHHKEGDRIIAMQDTFNTDDIVPSSIQLHNTDTSPELVQEFVDSKNSEAPNAAGSMIPSSSLHQQQQQLLLIPEIPSVISKAFGRQLPVIQEHVPSMQPKLPSPIVSQSTSTITATTTKEMNDISHNKEGEGFITDNNTSIRTDMKIVTDEDPYGE
jgi:hypothetical protein